MPSRCSTLKRNRLSTNQSGAGADSGQPEGARHQWWTLSDDALLAQCQWDRYRASGPGGQKRNKTDSAVRIRHQPTQVLVTAVESRSQHENRRRALRRLREALAFDVRQPINPDDAHHLPPALMQMAQSGRMAMRASDPDYLTCYSVLLDLLACFRGQVSSVADHLGVSTAQVVQFLREELGAWKQVQAIRQQNGLRPLH